MVVSYVNAIRPDPFFFDPFFFERVAAVAAVDGRP
jgi:hypothetical protein